MFDDHENGWARNIKKNEAGPKTIDEVRKEVENQYYEQE